MGFFARWLLAFVVFFRVWLDGRLALRVKAALSAPALPEPARPRSLSQEAERGAARLLAVMQREGRLVDFLREDVSSFDDGQVGAAARRVHDGCRRALDEFVTLVPVLDGDEGSAATIAEGFDPSAIRLVGEVRGDPPFRGTLVHHGWRAQRLSLPELPESMDALILQPAEVEVS